MLEMLVASEISLTQFDSALNADKKWLKKYENPMPPYRIIEV